jgi:hypothetical protein
MSSKYLNDLHKLIEKILLNHDIAPEKNNLRVSGDSLEASLFGFNYKFTKNNDQIDIQRNDGKKSFIDILEIPFIENVAMPRMVFMKKFEDEGNLRKEKFTDVAVRLNLIMEGDIYECTSAIFYLSAGSHKTSDIYVAAP